MSYKFPFERPLPRDVFDLAYEPISGNRYAAWQATAGIRIAAYTSGAVMNDALGSVAWATSSTKISFCIGIGSVRYLAKQSGADIIVNKDPTGSATQYTFAGLSPVLFFMGNAVDGALDVVCFYIKVGGDVVYFRTESESFGTEHTAITGFDFTLRQLQKSDALEIDGEMFHFLWGIDTTGRQVTFRTGDGLPLPNPLCGVFGLVDEGREEFECYAVEDPIVSSLTSTGGFTGPWAVHGTGAKILQRTISSIVDTRISLAVSPIARIIDIGSNWTTLRIGVQLVWNANVDVPTTGFYFGLCNGAANIIGDATVDHFIGMRIDPGFTDLTRVAGPPDYLELNNSAAVKLIKKVGTTITGTGALGGFVASAAPTTNRSVLFLEFVKNTTSPATSFTCIMGYPGVGGGAQIATDITLANFVTGINLAAGMGGLSAWQSGYQVTGSPASISADETANGIFNSIALAWDNATYPVEICAVAYKKLA